MKPYEPHEEYDVGVFDLWNGKDFKQIPDDLRDPYRLDDIHPTRAGHRGRRGPEPEKRLLDFMTIHQKEFAGL
ncbi:MAG: SGNH/GDSL hydrolase family protein [Clostridia bacterium]|nr:SGNH/GDSL hydrolase family protein [Clostridia bacterium]